MAKLLKGSLTATVLGVMCLSTGAYAQQTKPVEEMNLSDIRGMRFCEFLLVYEDRVDIYNTSASPGCPEEKFAAADPAAIAAEFGAKAAQVNGPKFWAMDEQTIGLGEIQTFAGIEARYGASLPLASLGSGKGADPYQPYVTQKSQRMVFIAGRPVYQLTGPDGGVFVLNAFGGAVKDGDPANLSEQLDLPDGWQFGVQTPDEDLIVIQRIETPSKMVGDDMHHYYSLMVPD